MESPLGSDLARLVRVWRALIDHRLKPLELTQTHWVTLHNIHQLPPEQSQIQLAKAIGIEQPSLVRTLDQLEEKGLISRQTCASDRRAKRIKLTEKAEPLINEMEEVIGKTRDEILSGVSKQEVETLLHLIINKISVMNQTAISSQPIILCHNGVKVWLRSSIKLTLSHGEWLEYSHDKTIMVNVKSIHAVNVRTCAFHECMMRWRK